MMRTILGVLRRWLTQEVALTNAAQASVRLQHHRRQLADVDAFIAAHHHLSQHTIDGELSTQTPHPRVPPTARP
jgi:hypothetical protein